MASREIVILGWYGNGNLGDEIILEVMLRDLRTVDPNASFVVISDDPKETERLHGVRSIGKSGTTKQRIRRFWEIVNSDLFVLGGGGILGSYGGSDRTLFAWLFPLRLAHELGLPTMTWGVGIGDRISPGEKEAMREILGKTDSICLRDRRSIEWLDRIGVRNGVTLTADPAILFLQEPPPSSYRRAGDAPPKVSVFIRHWYVSEDRVPDEACWDDFKASLAACLDSLISKKSAEVSFIPMRIKDPIDDDRAVAREISQIMHHGSHVKMVDRLMSSSELVEVLAQSDLVIGMRLHPLILASVLGIPSMAINYHPKVRSFMESIGAGEWTFEIGGENGSRFVDAAVAALSGGYPRDRVLARAAEAKELARLSTEAAARLLDDVSHKKRKVRRAVRAISVVASHIIGSGKGDHAS